MTLPQLNEEVNFAPSGARITDGPRVLIDAKALTTDNTSLWLTSGTGSQLFQTNKMLMSVAAGEYMLRETMLAAPYTSGYPLYIEMTADGFDHEPGVVKRMGYFSSSTSSPYTAALDGFWLESDGSTYRLVAYRNGTATVNVPYEHWSGREKLKEALGGEPDFTMFRAYMFDFLWLGGAALRLWVATNKGWILAHSVPYLGSSMDTIIQSPQQPLRYEIRSSTGAGSMRAICAQVSVLGDVADQGAERISQSLTGITCAAVGTIYALQGFKLDATLRKDVAARFDYIGETTASVNDTGTLMLLKNPVLSAALSYSAWENRLQRAYATNQTVTSAGTVIASAPASQSAQLVVGENSEAWMRMDFRGIPDEYVLAFMPATTNQTVYGCVGLKTFG